MILMLPRRTLLLAILLLPLAACAPPPPPLSEGPPPLEMGFALDAPDVVLVTLRDRQPVERAVLVAPDGRGFPADIVASSKFRIQSSGIPPQVAIGAEGGSSGMVSAGVGIGFPIFGSEAPSSDLLVESRFSVRIADLDLYRATWPQWKFRVTLGSPETTERTVEFPAPRPPDRS